MDAQQAEELKFSFARFFYYSYEKSLINSFDRQFSRCRHVEIITGISENFISLSAKAINISSLPAAVRLAQRGAVEQTFGGVQQNSGTTRLEWTLPEELATKAAILEYLAEVEATRGKGFARFRFGRRFARIIPARKLELTLKFYETVARAEHFQGRAFACFKCFRRKL